MRKALDYYTEMEKALEREKLNRTHSEKSKLKESATPKESEPPQEPGQALKPKIMCGQHAEQLKQKSLGSDSVWKA